ncbi:MAG: GNAT family N-acetyltransferase [Candidatus Gastranaerophilales bacterium]|nr:GNAT family N-acetyltransferase [Candidatus Gastranaerophilales bacterium]
MIKTIKIKPKDSYKLIDLCKMIKYFWVEYYKNTSPRNQLKYILKFISPETIKIEIKLDNKEYFFIEKDEKIVGFYQTKTQENTLKIGYFFIYEKYRNKKYGKTIFEKIKAQAKENNIDKIISYVNQDHKNSIEIFKHFGFKKIKPMAIYLGSDNFQFVYLMERKI